jgi:hypothetical protein
MTDTSAGLTEHDPLVIALNDKVMSAYPGYPEALTAISALLADLRGKLEGERAKVRALEAAMSIAQECGADILTWSGDKGMNARIKKAQKDIAALPASVDAKGEGIPQGISEMSEENYTCWNCGLKSWEHPTTWWIGLDGAQAHYGCDDCKPLLIEPALVIRPLEALPEQDGFKFLARWKDFHRTQICWMSWNDQWEIATNDGKYIAYVMRSELVGWFDLKDAAIDAASKPAAPTVDAITSNTHNHGNKS